MPDQPTRPSRATREEEERDANVKAGPDTVEGPSPKGDDAHADRDVAEHYEEMAERGARQEGEGRLP